MQITSFSRKIVFICPSYSFMTSAYLKHLLMCLMYDINVYELCIISIEPFAYRYKYSIWQLCLIWYFYNMLLSTKRLAIILPDSIKTVPIYNSGTDKIFNKLCFQVCRILIYGAVVVLVSLICSRILQLCNLLPLEIALHKDQHIMLMWRLD